MMTLTRWLSDKLDPLLYPFTPACYDKLTEMADRRFPSPVTALFRLFVLYIWLFIPLCWAGLCIGCFDPALHFAANLISGLVAAVLVTAGVLLVFLLLMALESFAKLFSSLILYGEVPAGAENPIDALLTRIFRGSKA